MGRSGRFCLFAIATAPDGHGGVGEIPPESAINPCFPEQHLTCYLTQNTMKGRHPEAGPPAGPVFAPGPRGTSITKYKQLRAEWDTGTGLGSRDSLYP